MSSSTSGNFVAALASFFVPGLGQLIQGRIIVALVFFVVVVGLWLFFLVGLGISWLVSKPPFLAAPIAVVRVNVMAAGPKALPLWHSHRDRRRNRALSGAAAEGVIVRCSFGGSFGPRSRRYQSQVTDLETIDCRNMLATRPQCGSISKEKRGITC